MLSLKGPLTLFAPTDAAFAKLPRHILDPYLFDRDLLAELVSNHILEGEIGSGSMLVFDARLSLCGKRFRTRRGALYVEKARIILPDMSCGNGLVHGINRVLLPPRKRHLKYKRRGRI